MSSRFGDRTLPNRQVAVGLLALALCTAAAGADIPRNKAVIDIDVIPGKLGPVRFFHAAHASVGWKADRSPITCKDCHHTLETDAPPSPSQDMRCTSCHPGVGEPDRIIGGRRARAMARLKPDGAIDYRSILFHAYCRDCHKKVQGGELRLQHCKVCHKRGIGTDATHGRYDSARQVEAGLAWLRCPAGQRWSGKRCEGEATPANLERAVHACPAGCRVPSLGEFLDVLEGCGTDAAAGREGSCRSCRESRICLRLFGPDDGTYWAASPDGDQAWTVHLSDGSFHAVSKATEALVRCVQPIQ